MLIVNYHMWNCVGFNLGILAIWELFLKSMKDTHGLEIM
jgi:hypothetical protein